MQVEGDRIGSAYVVFFVFLPLGAFKNFYPDFIIPFSQELEREKEERKDAELSVAAFKRQLASLKDKVASVEADIEQYRVLVQDLRRGTCTFHC